MRASRIRFVEIIVAVSVVVISMASLGVALFQGHVMQRTLEAQVLPVLQYGTGNFDSARDQWRMTMSLRNTGLGPAEVRHFQLIWNGEAIEDTSRFMARCCVPDAVPEDRRFRYVFETFQAGEMRLFFDGVDGRFIAPNEEVEFVVFERPDAETQPRGNAIWLALDDIRNDIGVELCYCSVFDDCWTATFPQRTREPVDQCPVVEPTFS